MRPPPDCPAIPVAGEAPAIYGSESSNTLPTLLPGEWVRIRGETKLKTLNYRRKQGLYASGNMEPILGHRKHKPIKVSQDANF